MNPLQGIGNSLSQFFAPAVGDINNLFNAIFHPQNSPNIGYISQAKAQTGAQNANGGQQTPDQIWMARHNAQQAAADAGQPIPGQQQSPTPMMPAQNPMVMGAQTGSSMQVPSAQQFLQGFNAYQPNLPIASQSGLFSQAAGKLPSNVDPYLPAIIALMETSGGQNMTGQNNFWNLAGGQTGGNNGFVNYPNLQTALLGGQNGPDTSKGFMGNLLTNPAYAPFLQSGNLQDFFNVATPPGPAHGNPTMDELLSRYQSLRSGFGR